MVSDLARFFMYLVTIIVFAMIFIAAFVLASA